MRFVWAVAAFVLAALMIAGGIAQRTVFDGPKTETTTVSQAQSAPFTVIDGAVLDRLPGVQTLRASGPGQVFVAYGRTADMKAWLADASYNHVTLSRSGQVRTRFVAPADSGVVPADATTDPNGSDLWLEQKVGKGGVVDRLQLPAGMSILVASDGTQPAPADVTITWPVHHTTPWAGPLMVGGAVLMAVGVFLYILGIRAARRSRGPRRKSPPPLDDARRSDLTDEAADKGVISAGAPRRSSATRRRVTVALPILLVGTLAFAGCSADAWPQFAATPTPTPSRTVITPADQQQPAVTTAQAGRILARISETVAAADQKKDATLAATRLDGPALAERQTNYTLRAKLPSQKAPAAVPATGLKVVLPQAYDGWPRTVMLVTEQKSGKTATSTVMMMQQHDPWSDYKLSYMGQLAVDKLPDVAPAYLGAAAVQPDSSFLVMAPQDISAAYADVIDQGAKSTYAGAFDTEQDVFLAGVAKDRAARLAAFEKSAQKKTGTLAFSAEAGPQPPVALATLESGAIVAVNVDEVDTVKPSGADAVIKLGDARVKALTGVAQSQTGFTTTYSDQLFFYVPGAGAGDARMTLLGYASNFLGAKVIGK